MVKVLPALLICSVLGVTFAGTLNGMWNNGRHNGQDNDGSMNGNWNRGDNNGNNNGGSFNGNGNRGGNNGNNNGGSKEIDWESYLPPGIKKPGKGRFTDSAESSIDSTDSGSDSTESGSFSEEEEDNNQGNFNPDGGHGNNLGNGNTDGRSHGNNNGNGNGWGSSRNNRWWSGGRTTDEDRENNPQWWQGAEPWWANTIWKRSPHKKWVDRFTKPDSWNDNSYYNPRDTQPGGKYYWKNYLPDLPIFNGMDD